MTASRLYPKIYKGQEESGGYVGKNEARKHGKSPHWRGRIYLRGVGWYWLSGWVRASRNGEIISLSAKAITDEEAEHYCAPYPSKRRERDADTDADSDSEDEHPEQTEQTEQTEHDSDIPF